tara:strand:- start:366 stop:1235 length:870 start_codon:yes stop_codon:yes gene_type:complete
MLTVVSIASLAIILAAIANAKVQDPALSSLQLDRYRLTLAPIELASIDDNASGISYNEKSDTLFVVVNDPEYLLEINKTGEVLRKIKLNGFDDTEAVVYLGQDRFAIAEERRRCIVFVNIDANTRVLNRSQQQLISFDFLAENNNRGFEGIAFDSTSQRLFVANEKSPRQLLAIEGAILNPLKIPLVNSFHVSAIWSDDNNQQKFLNSDDYSGLHFDNNSHRLLMLSDESRELIEFDNSGKQLSRLDLSWWNKDLTNSIKQPEGVTMDNDGNIYVISEPNLFYRFSPGI